MKKIIYILLAGSLLTNCNDLDVVDPTSLPQSEVLKSVSGYSAFLTAAYESVNDFGYYGQEMMVAPEILADNMHLNQFTGRYELEYVNAENSGVNIWDRYRAINEVNVIIGSIYDENVEGTDAEKDALVGQALFLRALFYHDLARSFGYEPGREVDGFDRSVVLKTTPTFGLSDAEDLPRASNVEVYDQIEADLLAAIPLLPSVTAGTSDVIFANQAAARLLLARVYLYEGNMTGAANYAQQVITGDGSDLVQAANYVASWDDATNAIHPESVFESEIRSADWSTVDGPNNSLHSLLMNDGPGSQFIITASDELLAEIASETGDVRGGLFVTEAPLGEEFQKWTATGSGLDFQENIPVLRLSEAYLIAAEALGSGAGDAIFNAFRAARGLGASTATVDNVLRERRIEFMAEGHRWFDLKRLGRDITKPAASNTATLPYSNFKVLPRIPQSDLNLSENLVNNPGYN